MWIFFIVVVVFAVIGAVAVTGHLKTIKKWESRPTLRQYLGRYPKCKTERGIKCSQCGAGSIKNWGLYGPQDQRRTFICNHCGAELYRSS